MRHPVIVASAACTSFVLGALLPWVPLTAADTAPQTGTVVSMTPVAVDAARSSTPAPEQRRGNRAGDPPATGSGVLALGDDRLHEAATCLEERGAHVHPRIVRDAEELLDVVRSAASGYAALLVHLESDRGLVDGDIERVLASAGPGVRVVWATVRLGGDSWGAFSPQDRINASIRNVLRRADQGRVLDWHAAVDRHPDWAWGGSLSSTGCAEYARKAITLSGVPRPGGA